jgi:hypothetical protein
MQQKKEVYQRLKKAECVLAKGEVCENKKFAQWLKEYESLVDLFEKLTNKRYVHNEQ